MGVILQTLEHFWNFFLGSGVGGAMVPIGILCYRSLKIAKTKLKQKKTNDKLEMFREFKRFLELGANQYIENNKEYDEQAKQNTDSN